MKQSILSGSASAGSRTLLEMVRCGAVSPEAALEMAGEIRSEKVKGKIAIIGMACRFPGAPNIDAFWKNLCSGIDAVGIIPDDRWYKKLLCNEKQGINGGLVLPRGGFLSGIDQFDPHFFNISRKEAALMDPHQRLFLQTAWHAVEDAGYAHRELDRQQCSVFVGCTTGDYLALLKANNVPLQSYAFMGNTDSILPARISYFLNLKGPAVAVDTACSSSLVAVHQACESIRSGASSMAIAGGVSVLLQPDFFFLAGNAGMLSESGKCRTFDQTADGFVPSEGVGAVVLKDAESALKDRDPIYGLIIGSAMNQDGRTNGITAPSARSQADLVRHVLQKAGVAPDTVQYIETHGTGTVLGDPIEIRALSDAFGRDTEKIGFCAVGSVKTNIGHTLYAAGVAGLIKTLLSLHHAKIPPHLHLEQLNRDIDFDNSPFFVNPVLMPWRREKGIPRRAGVSAFGFSGTNAHMLLEEAPDFAKIGWRESPGKALAEGAERLTLMSARSDEALISCIWNMEKWLDAHPDISLHALNRTLLQGRRHFDRRIGLVAASTAELKAGLGCLAHRLSTTGSQTGGFTPEHERVWLPVTENHDVQKHVAEMARAFVAGQEIDFAQISSIIGDDTGRMLPGLPGYPFATDRYWVTSLSADNSPDLLAEAALTQSNAKDPSPEFIRGQGVPADLKASPQQAVASAVHSESEGKHMQKSDIASITDMLVRDLVAHTASLLQVDTVDLQADDALSEYGFDSIAITELTHQINDCYGTELSPAIFFEYRSLAELGDYLLTEFGDAVAAFYSGTAMSVNSEESQIARIVMPPADMTDCKPHRITRELENTESEPIAIIGMAGVMPGSADLEVFWRHLENGDDLVSEIPGDRWDWRACYGDPLKEVKKTRAKWGGFMQDIRRFDARFFGISRREAELMDPQQRIFLEIVWQTLEDAGYRASDLAGSRTALFVGVAASDYNMLLREKLDDFEAHAPTGNAHSVLANRISYLLDLRGPSEPVDTACSSSLVAIHRGIEAIRHGGCTMAIAGGVNVILCPDLHIAFSKAGMLSQTGRCKTFDKDADGYVRGEGAGAILLKPLSNALADGDHVHALIRGSALNHGGRTSSLTVPNPKAQAELIVEACKTGGVDPRTVGYIEAHGTGTKLGDPVEVNGLLKGFRDAVEAVGGKHSSPASEYCGIGSVKANIGHLETASGMAGVLKVLLAMKYKKLPPSVHFNTLNPYIKLAGSPFYIVEKLQSWERLADVAGQSVPRRAGVSSFGFGGVNAHLLLEEFDTESIGQPDENFQDGVILVLSAKNRSALRQRAHFLLDWMRTAFAVHPFSFLEGLLASIAWTLQNGREAMSERLAFVAGSFQDAMDMLSRFLVSESITGLYTGRVKQTRRKAADKESARPVASETDLQIIARRWAGGDTVDWAVFYKAGTPRRLPLPVYPFGGESYWIPEDNSSILPSAGERHAMVRTLTDHGAERDGFSVDFETLLEKDAFFLRDHLIDGDAVLPGVCYLEIARAAAEKALEKEVAAIRNVVWTQPVTVNGPPVRLVTSITPDEKGAQFRVSSESTGGERTDYAHGSVVYNKTTATELVNLAAVKARCPNRMSGRDCYEIFRQYGLDYGPSFRTIAEVHYDQDEALALLRLPNAEVAEWGNGPAGTFPDSGLHPSIMDGALQAMVVLADDQHEPAPYLPFSIDSVRIHGAIEESCYAYVSRETVREGSGIRRFNILLCNSEGRSLVDFHRITVRPLVAAKKPNSAPPAPSNLLYAVPQWTVSKLLAIDSSSGNAASEIGHILLLDDESHLADSLRSRVCNGHQVIRVTAGNGYARHTERLFTVNPEKAEDFKHLFLTLKAEGLFPGLIVCAWQPTVSQDENFGQCLNRKVRPLFLLVKTVMAEVVASGKPASGERLKLFFLSYCGSAVMNPLDAAVCGFFRSASLEHPGIDYRMISIVENRESGLDWVRETAAIVMKEMSIAESESIDVQYAQNIRRIRKLTTVSQDLQQNPIPFPESGGVYLITGGAGGVGLQIAEAMARQKKVSLCLAGRSAPSPDIRERISHLESMGACVTYYRTDVSRKTDVEALVADIKADHPGGITGVIHAAGVLLDALILNKPVQAFMDVLRPKILGAVYLDQALAEEPIAFMCFFSSISALFGNRGQADYACANAFLDQFAAWREKCYRDNKRSGKTVAINWPLWAEGGMRIAPATMRFFKQRLGLSPLSTEDGLVALKSCLASPHSQMAVLSGDVARIQTVFGIGDKADPRVLPSQKAAVVDSEIAAVSKESNVCRLGPEAEKSVLKLLVAEAARILKVPEKEVDPEEELTVFGFDSITISEYSTRLNDSFGFDLTPDLFFEYPTLASFAGFIVGEYGELLTPSIGLSEAREDNRIQAIDDRPDADGPDSIAPSASSVMAEGINPVQDVCARDVAVIGMSGRMPGSPDLETFWHHLAAGDDLITEIPGERWDANAYYDPANRARNKVHSKWGGFMTDVDKFDARFFGISPQEAALMDPQHRLFMETVWSAIEDAGYCPANLWGTKTALFVGAATTDYREVIGQCDVEIQAHAATGNTQSILANRISYILNLRGPSEPIDTACSSSLIAIHRGVECIRSGRCDLAIAGGVNVMLSPTLFIAFGKAGMLSPDGKCRTFDKDANGYVRGEGVGAVLLKPLEKAITDRDAIYGVIKGTAVSHGGRANSLTAPNPAAQAELLEEAYADAAVDPRTVTYIECHGTGTMLGDPVEIRGLKKGFEKIISGCADKCAKQMPCALGSVKSNIGHLETAAGIAGFFKVLLAMQHRTIPGNIHFSSLNPHIRLKDSAFYVPTDASPWMAGPDADGSGAPRRAGISSFGFGGVNAHVVLESYETVDTVPVHTGQGQHPVIIVLSAKTTERLRAYARRLGDFLKAHMAAGEINDCHLRNIAFTLQVGREAMPERLAIVTGNLSDLIAGIDKYLSGQASSGKGVPAIYTGTCKTATPKKRTGDSGFANGNSASENVSPPVFREELAVCAEKWVKGAEIDWQQWYNGMASRPGRIHLPTYPFVRARHWVTDSNTVHRPIQKQFQEHQPPPDGVVPSLLLPSDSTSVVEADLQTTSVSSSDPLLDGRKSADEHEPEKKIMRRPIAAAVGRIISRLTGIPAEALDEKETWAGLGMDSILMMQFIQDVEYEFDVRLYPNEFLTHDSPQKIKQLIVKEVARGRSNITVCDASQTVRGSHQKRIVFLLSTPRAGSTLLRVMLMGHSRIFAPPELHMLPFETLAERDRLLKASGQTYLTEGLVQSVASLEQLSGETAAARLAAMAANSKTIPETYQYLLNRIEGDFLVDKSPSYAIDPRILEKAEQISPKPLYLYLVRHPRAVIDSFVRNRFDRLLGLSGDPVDIAEELWTRMNRNISSFLGRIPRERVCRVHYEDVVKRPSHTMRAICEWLDVDFDPLMTTPYVGDRMTKGLYPQSMPIGDPNFGKHCRIDPGLADQWRNGQEKFQDLDEQTRMMAAEIGYDFPQNEVMGLSPAQEGFFRRHGDDPACHISHYFEMRLPQALDLERFRKCLTEMAAEHGVLRHEFHKTSYGWQQRENASSRATFQYLQMTEVDLKKAVKALRRIEIGMHRQIRVEQAPLFAVAVMGMDENRYVVLWVIHHLVADGLSLSLMKTDLLRRYEQRSERAAAEIGLIDAGRQFAAYIRECGQIRPADLDEHLRFFKSHLPDAPLKLPDDKIAKAPDAVDDIENLDTIGSQRVHRRHLALKDIGMDRPSERQHLFTGLSLGLYNLLGRFCKTAHPVVAHRLHRRNIGTDGRYYNVAGWFAGDVPVGLPLDSAMAPLEAGNWLARILRTLPMGGTSYEILSHQGKIAPAHQITQVRLNYQPETRVPMTRTLATHLYEPPGHRRLYGFDLLVRPKKDHLLILAKYSANRHRRETMEQFVADWISLSKPFFEDASETLKGVSK